jgi:hypothetical protein
MKKTGSEMPSASAENAASAKIIDRARLQADVAQQRVRLAKDELRRARKRLKEAKREAKRTRRYASLARKDWKRAVRLAEKEGSAETPQDKVVTPRATRKPQSQSNSKAKAKTGTRSRRAATRPAAKRTRRTAKTRLGR